MGHGAQLSGGEEWGVGERFLQRTVSNRPRRLIK